MTYNKIHPHELYKINDNNAHVILDPSAEKDREQAFIFFNGTIYTGPTHTNIIYYQIKNQQLISYRFTRKKNFKIESNQISFGHILANKVAIIDSMTNVNCTDEDVKQALLAKGINKVYHGIMQNGLQLTDVTRIAKQRGKYMHKKRLLYKIAADDKENDIDINDFNFDDDNENDNDNTSSELEKMITNDGTYQQNEYDPYQDNNSSTSSTISSPNNMQLQLMQTMFNTLANDGRGVLKRIEDYKFRIIQSLNTFNSNPELKAKIEQKQKILESAAAQIYGIVFDLENYHLTPTYEEEQLGTSGLPEQEQEYTEDFNLANDLTDEENNDEEENEDTEETENDNEEENDEGEAKMQGGFNDEEAMEDEDLEIPEEKE